MLDIQKYTFFNPSPNFREMMILNLISQDNDISQDSMAKIVGVVPSMINKYLKDFEENGYLLKSGENKRNMSYELTDAGKKRLQFLIVSFVDEVSELYTETKDSFKKVFQTLKKDNIKNILLYGAGVVGGIVLKVLKDENINIVGFLDDSSLKQGDKLQGIDIYSPEKAKELIYDALIIASFRKSESILQKAIEKNLQKLYVFKIDDEGNISLEGRKNER
ncbi:MarR family transcriptional regulator [Petrotoga sp. 9PW.55.5.1]|uniref:winged helix-turn-helix transcriptional regulator n=1 Tax=Petrotoga sp. 9PW.55.5.1 TaxID=1308979 RepID=UPI000DC33DBB|nr:winged helix-turn-helix transcriptional regulator [Petrotoga sp. 9PW.55.5.1]RAO99187.1 MarR family transcriptional regulator [Petrotoga sp. 9PW.55.5.1]